MGHNVKVAYLHAVFPAIYYAGASIASRLLPHKLGSGEILYTRRETGMRTYVMDGVEAYRIPVLKYIPHGKCTRSSLTEAIAHIVELNAERGFVPDVITAHFHNPQLDVEAALKDIYPDAATGMVMHYAGDTLIKTYGATVPALMAKIDTWGFRSEKIKEEFAKKFGMPHRHFMCYSGVPDNYIVRDNNRDFPKKITRFIYVGNLISRKYPSAVVNAVSDVYGNEDFGITFAGTGHERERVEAAARKRGVSDRVKFAGHVAREEIVHYLDRAECFIMISRSEAFGLVYVEAMARGCIVIGSKNEGIDGIIRDGYNGFLCEAGNETQLADIIRRINGMTPAERKRISDAAVATARSLTDRRVAESYLEALCYNMLPAPAVSEHSV